MINEVKEALKEVTDEQISMIVKQLAFIHGYGARIWLVGNGGSSATASHLCSDLSNLGFDALCLNDNTSRLTAITNDHGWPIVYNIMIENHFNFGDCLIIFTVNGSSGKSSKGEKWSANLYGLAKYVREQNDGMGHIIVFSGNDGGNILKESSLCLSIHSKDPYIVEGVHSVLAHLVCKGLKEELS